jgi:hypothetical protein
LLNMMTFSFLRGFLGLARFRRVARILHSAGLTWSHMEYYMSLAWEVRIVAKSSHSDDIVINTGISS